MSWRDPAWDAIGIEPTSDARAIRTAYARRLKAIDPEADPQAFVALREAFERAQAIAQWIDREEDEDDAEALAEADVPALADAIAGAAAPAEPVEPAHPQPWRAAPEDADAHARALSQLVWEHDPPGRFATDEENAAMLAHWQAILADPRMQQVDFFADAEVWFARLLSGTAPFTDVLVRPVTRHFGWLGTDGSVRQSSALDAINHRYRVLEFLDAVQQPDHPHHEAWVELVTPADETSRRGRISIKKVHRLIHEIRTFYPDLEGCLDAYRVALWNPRALDETRQTHAYEEPRPARSGFLDGVGSYSGFFVLVAVLLFNVLGRCSEAMRAPSRPASEIGNFMDVAPLPALRELAPRLADQPRDIARVLQGVGDGTLDWQEVQARNPKLAQLLRSNWEIAKGDGKSVDEFVARMRDLLRERYVRSLPIASYANIAERRRIQIEEGKAMRASDASLCDAYFHGSRGVSGLRVPEALRAREQALVSRVLLETGEPPARKGDGTFTFSNAVFVKAARRAGLSEDAFSDAVNNRGTPGARCNARIALIEVALELPAREGLKLLREM